MHRFPDQSSYHDNFSNTFLISTSVELWQISTIILQRRPWYKSGHAMLCKSGYNSQKVFGQGATVGSFLSTSSLLWVSPVDIIFRCCREDIEISFPGIANLKYASHIATTIAIIGSTPYGTKSVIVEYLIAFLTELMRSENMWHAVDFKEFFHNLCSKGIPSSARRQGEFITLRVRIWPN